MNVKNLITKTAIFSALLGVSVPMMNETNVAHAAQVTLNYKNNGTLKNDDGTSTDAVGETTDKAMFAKAKSTIKIHKTHWYKHPYDKIAFNPYQISYNYSKGTWKLNKNIESHSWNNNSFFNDGPDDYIIDGYTYDQKGNKYYISYDQYSAEADTKKHANKPKKFSKNYHLLSTSFFRAPQVYHFTKSTNLATEYQTSTDDPWTALNLHHFLTNDYITDGPKEKFDFAPKAQANTFLLTNTKATFNGNNYRLIWLVTNIRSDDANEGLYGDVNAYWINTKDLKTNTKKGGTFYWYYQDQWTDKKLLNDTYTNKNIKNKVTTKVAKGDAMYY